MKSKSDVFKAKLLLRRVYNLIEMSHLNDLSVDDYYKEEIRFPKNLGKDIFNFLQSKDEDFRRIVITRQKRYRKRMKGKSKEGKK